MTNCLPGPNRHRLEIHDIGAPIADRQLAATLRANGVVLHGRLNDEEVRAVMADAMFGLLAYPVEYVAKSSVFAAYCAHGVCPVLFSQRYGEADGLVAGWQYLPGLPATRDFVDYAKAVGQSAFEWYQPHQLQRHAEVIRGFLSDRRGC